MINRDPALTYPRPNWNINLYLFLLGLRCHLLLPLYPVSPHPLFYNWKIIYLYIIIYKSYLSYYHIRSPRFSKHLCFYRFVLYRSLLYSSSIFTSSSCVKPATDSDYMCQGLAIVRNGQHAQDKGLATIVLPICDSLSGECILFFSSSLTIPTNTFVLLWITPRHLTLDIYFKHSCLIEILSFNILPRPYRVHELH